MSIHRSKGLEFPIVFVSGLAKSFNHQDSNARVLLHPDLGIAADCVDLETRVRSKTLQKQVFARKMRLDSLGEELRVLYVALTRAKEKLIVTYAKNRMIYGRTNPAGRLSDFISREVPSELVECEVPRAIPPRMQYSGYRRPDTERPKRPFGELDRRPDIMRQTTKRSGAASFGIERLAAGDRVVHSMFGEGVITHSKDMGGDVLYTVKFDTGDERRLMATFAKLKKI
jgi:hypothetical protein